VNYKELFKNNGKLRKMTAVMMDLGITKQNITSIIKSNFPKVKFKKIPNGRKPYFEADLTVQQVLFIAMSITSSSEQGRKVKQWLSENFKIEE